MNANEVGRWNVCMSLPSRVKRIRNGGLKGRGDIFRTF